MSLDEDELVEELNATVASSASSAPTADIVPPVPTNVEKAGSASDVDVMESLEFLNMLDNSQFGLRSKAAARMALAISEGITGQVVGSADAGRGGFDDDVEEGAAVEQQMDGVASHALGDAVVDYDDEDSEEWSGDEDDEDEDVVDDEENEEDGEEEDAMAAADEEQDDALVYDGILRECWVCYRTVVTPSTRLSPPQGQAHGITMSMMV